MKKILAIILCFVYVAASSNATINFHYCMGKFIGWNISVAAPVTCSNCGMSKEQKKGCCNDKHATFSIAKEQLASTVSEIPNNQFVFIQHQYPSLINSFVSIKNDSVKPIHGPPLIQPVSTLILNCVFRV